MDRKVLLFAIGFFCILIANAQNTANIKGKVLGDEKEPLIGATVSIKEAGINTVVGLDGTYLLKNVPVGKHVLEFSYIGYDKEIITLDVNGNERSIIQDVKLKEKTQDLKEVSITAKYASGSESGARGAEKNADLVTNSISAATIEASPDITVANVVQRVSGLTVERNNNGDGQYAIVRGMNKRYNYTLVNGIKIPSPDNENRYVPLDIFPSELLDELQVSKALTPSMEGDAIGGVVNLKMKDAPLERMVSATVTTGFSELFIPSMGGRQYDYYDVSAVSRTSPINAAPAGTRAVGIDAFTSENMNFEQRNVRPNLLASLSLGDRFLDGRLGVVVAGSYQNTFRGADRDEFGINDNNFGNPRPRLSKYQRRRYSVEQERAGIHNKIDYQISPSSKISLYNVFLHLQNNETRIIEEDGLRDPNLPNLEFNLRGQTNIQQIYNSTLQGEHNIGDRMSADWSLVYSMATNEFPDNSQLESQSNYPRGQAENLRFLLWENNIRIWEENSDQDLAAYYNFNFDTRILGQDVLLKTGGLVRNKRRENFFDRYTFKPNPGVQEYVPFETDYADLTWRVTGGSGTPTHVLNYQSHEDIFAHYGEFKFIRGNTQFVGGVRAEHTDQGYTTLDDRIPDSSQIYWSILPSLHIKHMPSKKINIRASYFNSLSRPSFLEIIPYRRPGSEEIVPMGGNPNLKPVTAHNFDARFEYFPTAVDQFLVGAFYKIIDNPIENAILPPTNPNFPDFLPPATTMLPLNLETAINSGIEVDIIKYFNKFGIRANYTFTNSEIESIKRTRQEVTEENIDQLTELQRETVNIGDTTLLNVTQNRPLQGQSRHVGNLSLLYKNQDKGWNIQLSMVFTGERIAVVAPGLDTDWWQRDFTQFDFSMEKTFKKKITVFCKIANLTNEPFELYIKEPHISHVTGNELQPNSAEETLVRRDIFQRSYLFGIKYRL